jgi:hypothetical protein
MEQNTKITLQSTGDRHSGRIAYIAEQLRGWTEDENNKPSPPSSVQICFSASPENPLTMGDISYFLDANRDFLEGCHTEWCYKTDATLGDKVLITLSFEPRN